MNTTAVSTTYENATEGSANPAGSQSNQPSPEVYTMNIIFGVLGVAGILGNIIVCVVILKVRDLRTTNMFIFNQSLVDLVSSLLVVTQNLGPNKYNVVVPVGVAGDVLCKLWLSRYFMWATFNVSTYNLIALTLERYMAIVFPLVHRQHFSMFKARCGCVFVWALGLAYQSYWAKANYNRGNGSCGVYYPEGSMQVVVGVMVFLVEYFIPILLMAFSYTSMFVVLKRRSRKLGVATAASQAASTSGANPQRKANEQQESPANVKARKNVLKMLVAVCVTYAICWGPNHYIYLEYNVAGKYHTRILINTTVVMAFCNMCVNPVIYALKYRQFQEGVRKLLCGHRRVGPLSSTEATHPSGNTGPTQSSKVSSHVDRNAEATDDRFLKPQQ